MYLDVQTTQIQVRDLLSLVRLRILLPSTAIFYKLIISLTSPPLSEKDPSFERKALDLYQCRYSKLQPPEGPHPAVPISNAHFMTRRRPMILKFNMDKVSAPTLIQLSYLSKFFQINGYTAGKEREKRIQSRAYGARRLPLDQLP